MRILMIIVLLCVGTGLFAEELPLWILLEHELSQEETYADMNRIVQKGYFPAGLEVRDKSISVLYYLAPERALSKWILYEFSDLSVLNGEFSTFLQEGWSPVDIALGDDSLFALFIPASSEIKGWRIVTVDSLSQLELQHAVYKEQGYDLSGLSQEASGSYWLLFLTPAQEPHFNVDILSPLSEAQALESLLTEHIVAGHIPQSLLMNEDAGYLLRFRSPSSSIDVSTDEE